MFNYLKKHNMRNSLKTLLCLTAICVFSNNAAARICFLPDGDCGKTKININSGKNGCIYKSEKEANTGKNDECEVSYQSQVNSCWWRRCNSDNKTIFDKLADCQKKIEDATSQKCQACGSCYKLVTIPIPPNACPDGYSTKYQSLNDCGDNESFSENGTYNGLVCGACTKTETKTCNEINSSYYSVSNTAKYDECKKLDEYYNDNDLFVMETTNVTGSDGQCFDCHRRTCAEIAEFREEGVKWYTSCKTGEIAEDVGFSGADGQCFYCNSRTCAEIAEFRKEGVKWYTSCKTGEIAEDVGFSGVDGQCYTCKKTSDMLCSQINSSYIGAKSSCKDEEYYKKTVVNGVTGSDGQCYTCNLRTCNDIDSDWISKDQSCPSDAHYRKYKNGKNGSDGQCYECEQLYTNIVVLLQRGIIDDEPCALPYAGPQSKATWYTWLEIDGEDYYDIDTATYTLPFDMEIVTTYKVPYVHCDNPATRPVSYDVNDYAFAPRTERVIVPKGTKFNQRIDTVVVGYAGSPDRFNGVETITNVEYYINGQKLHDLYIGNIHYSFIEDDNG